MMDPRELARRCPYDELLVHACEPAHPEHVGATIDELWEALERKRGLDGTLSDHLYHPRTAWYREYLVSRTRPTTNEGKA